jgi:hypothetical protein
VSPRGGPKCRDCGAPIVFFGAPSSPKQCPFDPAPVAPSHPLAGVRAFPVLGGRKAYRPAHLAEVLQVQRMSTISAAQDEVQDLPWHLIHECRPDPKDPV